MTISFIQAVPLSTSPAIEVKMVSSVCLCSIAVLQSGSIVINTIIVTVTLHQNSKIVKIVTLIVLTFIIIISMTMMAIMTLIIIMTLMLIMVMMVIMTLMIMAIVMMI